MNARSKESMENPVQRAGALGQSIWYDNVRRGLITSGELAGLIELGVSGLTSNPTIFEKAIAGSTDYDEALLLLGREPCAEEVYEALALEDIQAAADLLRPIYDQTAGADGYASLEVSPTLAHDTDGSFAEAKRLFAALDRPNVLVKLPATEEGIPAIERLIGEGVNVNVTLLFSLDSYRRVREAYIGGLSRLASSGGDVSRVASVASFFVSRVDTAVDSLLEGLIREGRSDLTPLLGQAAIANAALAYRDFRDTFQGEAFGALRAQGARVQRPLWASTGTKNTAYSDVLYVESLMGPDTVNTVPPATLIAFLEHGVAEPTLAGAASNAETVLDGLAAAGIDIDRVTDRLLSDGVDAFSGSFRNLLGNIEEKRSRLGAGLPRRRPAEGLGVEAAVVDSALADLDAQQMVPRIWRRDHTVWNPEPREIADRLGWLTVTDQMREQVPALEAFAREVVEEGYTRVVLLGMGGSSLGPEVMRGVLGGAPGYPDLTVLDSTVPQWVAAITGDVDPRRTLFLVSSKSGTTVEPLSLYAHFRDLVEGAVGADRAGRSFVAITDPGTSLEELARAKGFRRAFLNPPDIGGRYSVLSYFGLVPAALMGIDLSALLDRADCMREGCASCVPVRDNPGAWLGAAMASLAHGGRDKLSLVTSPALEAFGLWVEQLIAESTGKDGRGIIPVAGEPLLPSDSYGKDRLFVFLRLEGDDNSEVDGAVARLTSGGHPIVRLDLRDRYDLGAELFRWEFATAVAGSILGIHPFDQPDVQGAKDMTDLVLGEHAIQGKLPEEECPGSLKDLVSGARPGDYLAIMAYLRPTPELEAALVHLRRTVGLRYRIATAMGYGPRYLHSTGQLHKGGPDRGLFLQLTHDGAEDLPIPGRPHGFGVLAGAQSLGDLRALRSLGRRVARVRLGDDPAADVLGLADELAM